MQGTSVTLKVQMGRWRCRSRQCLRQIFTERVEGILLPHSQQTNRLSEVHRLVGRALGGRSGQRLLKRLGMPSSRHTLLRQVIQGARGSARQDAIRVVGVDDWAWRKGQSFGTILVDLERSEEIGFELSLPPPCGQAGLPALVDEARAENWHSCADAICTNFATRPPRRRSSSNGTLEQRTGRGTH
jgi:hypothetical protein